MKCRLLALSAMAIAAWPCGCRSTPLPRPEAPKPRVITFSPALTDIVFQMGLGDHVVGVTAYCNVPAGQKREVAGDRQNVKVERILRFQPDVILVQQNPQDFEQVRTAKPELRVEHFRIETLADVAEAVERIGALIGDPRLGAEKRAAFQAKLDAVRARVKDLPRPKVLFLTGFDPPSVPGRESFLHEIIELAGAEDAAGDLARWSQINIERMLAARPEVVVCQTAAGQEARVKAEILAFKDLPAAKSGRVFVVTDPRWKVPSMHLADSAGELAAMVHPELGKGGTGP